MKKDFFPNYKTDMSDMSYGQRTCTQLEVSATATSFCLRHWIKKEIILGHLGAPLVKRPALGFSLGHDLTVCEFEPTCAGSVEPALDSLSPSLSTPPPLVLSLSLFLSLSKNK